MPKIINLVGKKFGSLTVINKYGINKQGLNRWLCKCDCGNKTIVLGVSLTKGHTRSCGCMRCNSGGKTHGMKGTRIYDIWEGMKTRCLNINQVSYKNYGGRGIKVCDKWLRFEGFYEDMGKSYIDETLTLDRIDFNGNYCKENCKWSTVLEQANNTRHNKFIEYNDEIDTLSNLCRKYNKNYGTIKSRLRYGWTVERAFTQEVKK